MKDKVTCARPLHEIFGALKKNKILVVALLVLGIGILLVSFDGSDASAASERDALEEQLEEMCSSLNGVGSCRVMITYKTTEGRYGAPERKTVESVAVVCKGADKIGVRRELTDMMAALFGIGANRIYISKMK